MSAASPSTASHPVLGALAADNPLPEGITLVRTTDELNQPHALVLHAAGIEEAVQRNQLFAVLSPGSGISVTGDVAIGGWRFAVDSSATGQAAPIVVLKFAGQSLRQLAADPESWADIAGAGDDAGETSARLTALVATATSQAEGPSRSFYAPLAEVMQDPTWTGVLIFNASVSAMPKEVVGRSTDGLAGSQVSAFAVGAAETSLDGLPLSPVNPPPVFGTIDQTWAANDAPAPDIQYVRARFENGELVDFSMGAA